MKRYLFLCLVLLAGCVGNLEKEVDPQVKGSFEECVADGGLLMESYPRQCKDNEGNVFVEQGVDEKSESKNLEKSLCEDLCGDGACDEIVCQAEGCPCAETAISCPSDCR